MINNEDIRTGTIYKVKDYAGLDTNETSHILIVDNSTDFEAAPYLVVDLPSSEVIVNLKDLSDINNYMTVVSKVCSISKLL